MELGDWQSKKSFGDTNLYMLEKQVGCDITFLVGEDKAAVRAHRFILVSRSCLFYAMLEGPLAEHSGTVTIPDIEKDIFEILIRYLYSEVVNLSADTVMAVMYAAKKYGAQGLIDKCTDFLKQNMSTENVCTILDQANTFSEKQLKSTCLSFIFKHGNEVLQSENFLELNPTLFTLVIESDLLIASEDNVYRSCLAWSLAECGRRKLPVNSENQRTVLGNNLYLIRFPVMSLTYFTDVVSNENLLTAEEKVHLFQCLIKKDSDIKCKFVKNRRFSSVQFSFNGHGLYGKGIFSINPTLSAN